MKIIKASTSFLFMLFLLSSCGISKKQYEGLQIELDLANKQLGECGESINDYLNKLAECEKSKEGLRGQMNVSDNNLKLREEQIADLKELIADIRKQRDKQSTQMDDLTVLTQSASDNIKETLSQLEGKDKYIQILQAAKTRADSINLALSVNLKGVLADGINDQDIEVKVDKTVVFVNLSDKMLFQSGDTRMTPKAYDVLKKIALIVQDRPDLEVMVEGYTDNRPISKPGIEDNWDLSVKRATSVVRVLQKNYGVDPNRLIAAGRGEYNALATNDAADGRSMNRRTRIIILPKLNQFYDLLNPEFSKN